MAKRPKPRGQNGTLTLERLMERVAEFVAAQRYPQYLTIPIDRIVRAAGAAAAPVVAVTPTTGLAPAALRLAVATGTDVDGQVAALISAVENKVGYSEPSNGRATLIRALGLVGERDDLKAAIAAIEAPANTYLEKVINAWVELGRLDEAQAEATRWLAANHGVFSMFVEAGAIGRMAGELARTDFAAGKRWMETIRPGDRATAIKSGLAGFVTLADDELDTLLAMVERATMTTAAEQLAAALLAAGREDAARRIRLAPADNDLNRVEALRDLGDEEGARALLREGSQPDYDTLVWPRHKIELDVEPLDDIWPPFATIDKVSKSVMAAAQRLTVLGIAAHERGASADELAPLIKELRKLLKKGPKTQYDHGVAESFNEYAESFMLRVRAPTADAAELRGWFEGRRKALKGVGSDTKALRIDSQVRLALQLGLPDEAYKTAKKMTIKKRHKNAAPVVEGFLPDDPAGALASLEGLAAKDARAWLAGALTITRALV